MKILFSDGWNRVTPHDLLKSEGFVECTKLQNYVCGRNCITKIDGTRAYNSTSLGNYGIPWVERSYHIIGDGSIVKRTFCFYQGKIYHGDDVNGTLTEDIGGFRVGATPLSQSFQVSGNSILFVFTGEDVPYKYDGNGSYTWEKTSLDAGIVGAVSHLTRMWYWYNKTSTLIYSSTLFPEIADDEISVGDNARDSYIVACVKTGNEGFYVFKNDSIWELSGRTSTQFSFRRVTDVYGLTNKRAYCVVPGGGIVFQNSKDNELYSFGGTEASIRPMTERNIRLREIQDQTPDSIENSCMTVHNNLFRFAFQHTASQIDANDCELVYPLDEMKSDGTPKFSLIKGSNVSAYTIFERYGDNNELVTGRSDIGKIMYHGNTQKNFDDLPIETIVKTPDMTASGTNNVRFKDFYIKTRPNSYVHPLDFRYYLNGRSSDYKNISYIPAGELREIGAIKSQKSDIVNDRLQPYGDAVGNSIAFEIYDNHLGTDVEIHSIDFSAMDRGKMRSQLVGG